jgi:hypothetical protein
MNAEAAAAFYEAEAAALARYRNPGSAAAFSGTGAAAAAYRTAGDAEASDLAMQLVNLLRTQIAGQMADGSADSEADSTRDLASQFVDLLKMTVAEQMAAPSTTPAAAGAPLNAAAAAAHEDNSSAELGSGEPMEHLIGGLPAVFCHTRSHWSQQYGWGGVPECAAVVPGTAGVIRTRLNPSAPTSMTQVSYRHGDRVEVWVQQLQSKQQYCRALLG